MPSSLRVGLYAVDPVGLTSFHAFDPESYFLVTTLADTLVHIGIEGQVEPGLATSWERLSPTLVEFQLREGVTFHNGEDFDADSVVATFEAHRKPTPSASAGVLDPIKAVTKQGSHRIHIETKFPDAMLLRRMFWSEVYPKSILEKHGRDQLADRPIGTGAYKLERWTRGREIVLVRNEQHWAGRASVDELRLPILRQKEWLEQLNRGYLDVAWNIDSNDRVRAARLPGIQVGSREAAVSQWFLLRNRGPLASLEVRQALNHAINRPLLVELAEHGFGEPQRGIATKEQEGYAIQGAYRYSPELARRYLQQAGFGGGFKLSGIVSESSTGLYFAVREFLSRVGIELQAEVVPRTEWVNKVVMGNLQGRPYDCDFAVASLDNPLLDPLFHHYILLFSHGPFSLTHDADYDRAFMKAASSVHHSMTDIGHRAELDRFARDNALMLFTVQQQVHAAWRDGVEVALPRSGHFGAAAFWNLKGDTSRPAVGRALSEPPLAATSPDLATLVDGTSHTGTFYLRPGTNFYEGAARRVWTNIVVAEERWHVQNEPMLKELVSQIEAKTNLSNVLGSTDRVAIAGYTNERRLLYVNRGYRLMFGETERSAFELLDASPGARWAAIEQQVERTGAWLGPVTLPSPSGASLELFLSVTRATDDEGSTIGHTFVFSDFSGEQERIRNEAIRSILDNVPYGLFRCDREGRLLSGFSTAARQFFRGDGAELAGQPLSQLLGLAPREARHFELCYSQIIDDALPEAVSLHQLPQQLQLGELFCKLDASVVRDSTGRVNSVLFTLLDVTSLAHAEHEVERLRAIAQVLRFKSSFESFVHFLLERLATLSTDLANAERQLEARRVLHTAKGVFAQFSLMDLARLVHRLEDERQLQTAHLTSLKEQIEQILAKNRLYWGIGLESGDAQFSPSESLLRELEGRVAEAEGEDELRALLTETFARIREKPVSELAGPLEEHHDLLCRRLGKSSRFQLHGGNVSCPVMFAEVFDTLTHLVRNAVDHGIEPSAERQPKSSTARVELRAQRTPSELVLSVSDDGRGIDVDALATRALNMSLIDETDLSRLNARERLRLILLDGLSTSQQVTETSGRGVGVASVKLAVERLGGSIEVDSELGRGTQITVRLPLASSRGVLH